MHLSVSYDLVRILHSAEKDNLSPLDSDIACLCQSIEINNNKPLKYMYCIMHLSDLYTIKTPSFFPLYNALLYKACW